MFPSRKIKINYSGHGLKKLMKDKAKEKESGKGKLYDKLKTLYDMAMPSAATATSSA